MEDSIQQGMKHGVPSNADFYVNAENVEQKEYAETKNEIDGLKPVSKKGAQAWNLITQENAKNVSNYMYTGENYGVISKLVDSYAWDRIVNWIVSSNKYGNIAENSKTYGNYADNDEGKIITTNSSLYAEHLMKTNIVNSHDDGWCLPKHYKYGTFTTGYQINWDGNTLDYRNTEDDMQYYHYLEMSTGASDKTKLNNIYDLAGNVSEYTTEYGYHGKSSETGTKYAVLRGGNFWDLSQGVPISYRDANVTSEETHPRFGFRVVLYVK